MRRPLIVANWKMNGDFAANEALFTALRNGGGGVGSAFSNAIDAVICPPFPYLGHSTAWLTDTNFKLGAQNSSAYKNGAYTGEVSAAMLGDLGCQWVILGHSERRTYFGESNEVVAQKLELALDSQLSCIVCVGETLSENEAGLTEPILAAQVEAIAPLFAKFPPTMCVLAYEPVWAIGTGRSASPEQAQGVHRFLRNRLQSKGVAHADQIRILYGGSVKPSNALTLLSMSDIDGALVGGASLIADDFISICRAAAVA